MELFVFRERAKKLAILSVYRVGEHGNPGQATSPAHQFRTQYADESARVHIDPFKQTLINLGYFVLYLKQRGHKVAIVIDVNEVEDRNVRPQPHSQQL
jgi:hypothetical protein